MHIPSAHAHPVNSICPGRRGAPWIVFPLATDHRLLPRVTGGLSGPSRKDAAFGRHFARAEGRKAIAHLPPRARYRKFIQPDALDDVRSRAAQTRRIKELAVSSTATVAPEAVNIKNTTTPAAPAPAAGAESGNALAALLLVPPIEAMEKLHAQCERGSEIRDVRIRYVEDLEEARARKLAWTHQSTALRMSLFATSEVADFCNDWVGKIFPEYAEFGNFVEQFYE
jgi:hypothetical protein